MGRSRELKTTYNGKLITWYPIDWVEHMKSNWWVCTVQGEDEDGQEYIGTSQGDRDHFDDYNSGEVDDIEIIEVKGQ
jgi:hypothetical protein